MSNSVLKELFIMKYTDNKLFLYKTLKIAFVMLKYYFLFFKFLYHLLT